MPFAFGHLIGAWIAGKIYEKASKKKITHYVWFFLLFGAILPDAELLVDWTFGTSLHRTFTHSLLFAFAMGTLISVIFKLLKNKEHTAFGTALGCGILTHIFLDFLSLPGVPILWPSSIYFSLQYIGPLLPGYEGHSIKLAIVDMALGAAWIFYLWFRKRLQF